MSFQSDPWVVVKACLCFAADLVFSALAKETRRGNIWNAALLAYEIAITNPAMEDCPWQ